MAQLRRPLGSDELALREWLLIDHLPERVGGLSGPTACGVGGLQGLALPHITLTFASGDYKVFRRPRH